jgi:hypothetical protein
VYLLDANILIRAKNDYYDFKVCPGFWDWLVEANKRGVVGSIDAVRDELIAGVDELSDWAGDNKSFFLPLTSEVVRSIGEVNAWAAVSLDYDPAAKAEFASVADSSLIGHAREGGHTVVTHETAGNSRKRIKVPNAAAAHGVRVTNPFLMLRTEQARFVLGAAS